MNAVTDYAIPMKIKAFALGLLMLSLLSACSDPAPMTVTDVRLGVPKQPSSALIFVAMEQGLFKAQGLNIQPSYFPSGKRALVDGLLQNKVDYITTSDIPVIWKSFSYDDLRILTALYSADNVNRIIARKDAGIAKPADLAGKRVATQRQSAVHYFLHSFVLENKLPHEGLEYRFFKAGKLPEKLAAAEIDAFSMREPYISRAVKLIGEDKVVIFQSPGLYIQNELLVGRTSFLKDHAKVSKGLVRALIEAERFVQKNPEQAMAIVSKMLKADPERIRGLWKTFDLKVQLEQALMLRLELQAKWLIEDGLVESDKIPDVQALIDSQALNAVKPEANMIVQ